MKNFLSFLILFFLSLLQSTVTSINFLLVFVLWQGRYYWAFLAGLVFDLMAGQRLGLSSLLFLFILLFFRLYRRKFEPRAPFLVTFVLLVSYLFAKIEGQIWSFDQGLIPALLILLLRRRFSREKQLKLDL